MNDEPEYPATGGSDRDASRAADDEREGGAVQDETALLWPEREVEISGERTVTVREMTWGQSMRLTRHWKPLADKLFRIVRGNPEAEEIDPQAVADLLEEHGESVIELLVACTDLDQDDIDGLSLTDGQMLLVTWLGVHLDFFGKRLQLATQLSAGLSRGLARARELERQSAASH